MKLIINIVLVILSYRCITICTFQFGMEKYRSDVSIKSGESDCSLWPPVEDALKMPIAIALTSNSSMHSIICPDRNGRLNIKHNSYFKLSCETGKFVSADLINTGEANVRCLNKDSLEFEGKTYTYKDFKCNKIPKSKLKKSKEECEESAYKYFSLLNEIGSFDCYIMMPLIDYNMPIPFTSNATAPSVIHPDKNGNLVIKQNETFFLSCAGNTFQSPSRVFSELKVKCLNGTFLQYRGRAYHFDQFKCQDVPSSVLRPTKKTCQTYHNNVVEVGFQTNKSFLNLYYICFDAWEKHTLYTWYFVDAPIFKHRQSKNMTTRLKKPVLFGNLDILTAYRNQTETMEIIVKSRVLANWYIASEKLRLLLPSRITCKREFVYFFEQYAAYYFENTAPQWFVVHEGAWKDLERLFRRNLARSSSRHVIVSGTYRTSYLPDLPLLNASTYHPLYLSLPKSVVVPLYFWKIDYDLDKRTGMVYITMNNPYKPIDESVYICDVVKCPGTLTRRIFPEEPIFCCTIESFEKTYGQFRIPGVSFH